MGSAVVAQDWILLRLSKLQILEMVASLLFSRKVIAMA